MSFCPISFPHFSPSHLVCFSFFSGYVLVAWSWSAIWYFPLDPIKWALCWILNEDGFRDPTAHLKKITESKSIFSKKPEETTVTGGGGSHANPLGRVSLSKTPADVLDKKSASVVAVTRDGTGAVKMNTDSSSNIAIARNSMKKT